MMKKLSLALFLGLVACSDDSSSGTDANIDTGDEINIPVSDKVSSATDKSVSSSSKIDTLRVEAYDSEESGSYQRVVMR